MNLKNKYLMLVVDFDGTLVDTDFRISLELKQAIKKVMDKGYFFVIVTGRCYQGIIKEVCKTLGLRAPQIVSGGSEIIDPQTDQILWQEYVPGDSARKIITSFLENNLQFSVESQGYVFTPSGQEVKGYGPGVIFKGLNELDYDAVSKIVLDKKDIEDLKKKEGELSNLYPDLYITRSGMKGHPVLDITSAKATKHSAILKLSGMLKLEPKSIIGVGDGYNDYPLLSVCGLKVAMGSAPGKLQEMADIILPDVSHGGLVTLLGNL